LLEQQEKISLPADPLLSGEEIDRRDFGLLRQTVSRYVEIVKSDRLRLLWARAFARLDPKKLSGPCPEDGPYKLQTCMALVKNLNDFLSQPSDSPELSAFLYVCSSVQIFFRGSLPRLGHFFQQMDSLPREALHPDQIAPDPRFKEEDLPRPPKSCWRNPIEWMRDDWPDDHCVSWDHSYTLLKGIIGDTPVDLREKTGLVERVFLSTHVMRGDWRGFWESVRGMACHVLGLTREPPSSGDFCVKLTHSEFSSLIDVSNPTVLVNLIKAGINPFAIMDTSESATRQITQWRQGANSVHYVPFLHLACQFGRREVVEAFLGDRESFRRYYAAPHTEDTPYVRAVMNQKHSSVLIPFLEEAEQDPSGGLALEIRDLAGREESSCYADPVLSWALVGESWRKYPQNYLILACVSGDVDFARYLVEKEEERATRICLPEATKADRQIKAAIAAGCFVNEKGKFGAPGGTPVEVAVRFGHQEMVQFLCSKGATVSLEIRLKTTQQIGEQMREVIDLWGKRQDQMLQKFGRDWADGGQSYLHEMAAIAAVRRKDLADETKTLQLGNNISQEIRQGLGEINDLLNQMEEELIFVRYLMEHFNDTRNSSSKCGSNVLAGSKFEQRAYA